MDLNNGEFCEIRVADCDVCGGGDGRTKMKYLKLNRMHKRENSGFANLVKYVPDPDLRNLIFGRKPNGIRPSATNRASRMI